MGKTLNILFVFCSLIIISSCSKKPLHTSKSLDQDTEDYFPGSIEWIDKLGYDTKNKIAVGVYNDDKDLLIRVMAHDQSTIRKMFITGFTIWIDTTGGKDKHFGIKYPMAQGRQGMNDQNTRPNQMQGDGLVGRQEDLMKKVKTSLNSIELTGFSLEAQNSTKLNSRIRDGITAWIELTPDTKMYYELKIPLKYLANVDYLKQNLISVGFESGKIDMPSAGSPGSGGKMGGGKGSGGGRPGGGGGRSHGGSGQNQQTAVMKTMSQPINIWMKRIELFRKN